MGDTTRSIQSGRRIRVINDSCKACHRCEVACIASHHNLTMKEAMKCRTQYEPRVHVIKTDDFKVSVRCRQCVDASCASVCPVGAIVQLDSGEIIMHPDHCIGCGSCVRACPYGAVTLETVQPEVEGDPVRQVAVRCDLCKDWRAATGNQFTACMEACPVQALAMVDELNAIIVSPPPKPQKVAKTAGQEKE